MHRPKIFDLLFLVPIQVCKCSPDHQMIYPLLIVFRVLVCEAPVFVRIGILDSENLTFLCCSLPHHYIPKNLKEFKLIRSIYRFNMVWVAMHEFCLKIYIPKGY